MHCCNALKCIFNINKNSTETIFVLYIILEVFVDSLQTTDVGTVGIKVQDRFDILIKLKCIKIVGVDTVIYARLMLDLAMI